MTKCACKSKQCKLPPPCELQPTIVVYYSVTESGTNVSSVMVGNTVLGTINGPLYRDPSLQTAYPNERIGVSQAIFVGPSSASLSGQFTLFLNDGVNIGTVTCQPAGLATSIAENRYVLPAGVYMFEITSGTKSFFRKPGFIRLTVVSTGLRTFEIFFDN
jgi:hypothetical protein